MAQGERRPRRALRWLLGAGAVVLGALIGVGFFTASYSDATGYLGSDPKTCTNCHAMGDIYDSWHAGPHAKVATCNDCHLPHGSTVEKYIVKMEDGLLHGSKFTTGDYPQNIKIREASAKVVNAQCLECHGTMTSDIRAAMPAGEELSCIRCHAQTGH
jgi:cytochrome c nitrite reductase small subunit